MLTATRALALSQADPLPEVPALAELTAYGVRLRRGQLAMVAGQSGSLKSTFVQWLIEQMGVSALYLAADQDAFTSITRLAAQRTGDRVDDIAEDMNGPGAGFYEEAIADSRIQWCFESEPTIDDIDLELMAYVELWDAFPEVIVVDNLMNVNSGGGDGYLNWAESMNVFQGMARTTNACVMVLHHMTEGTAVKPNEPQPKREILGKVSQRPELIFTVAFDPTDNTFVLSPVKNRSGKSSADAKIRFRLSSDPERASFGKHIPRISYGGGWQ